MAWNGNLSFMDNLFEDIELSQCLDIFEEDLALSQCLDQTEMELGIGSVETGVDFLLTQNVTNFLEEIEGNGDNITSVQSETILSENVDVKTDISCVLPSTDRYDILQDSDIRERIEQSVPKNTKKSTNWAVNAFNEWRSVRNSNKFSNHVPSLECFQVEDINNQLSRFLMEVKKRDGSYYPARSLYLLASGVLRHLRDSGVQNMNFLNEKDDRFLTFRKCLDAQMKYVTSMGVGASVKQADPVSEEQEETLWETGKFGFDCAESLLNAVFFYNCKLFGMRGRDEHYNLEKDQFIISEDDGGKFVQFIGRSNKTFKGGLKHKKVENKNIKHYSSDRVFRIYKDYTNLLDTSDAVVKFYRRPLKGKKSLSTQVLGKNKLENMMKTICSNLQGNFTNQSGKRTCATSLYQAGVDEQSIMDRTGHRSVQGVRKYKRPSSSQLRDISNVLDSKKQRVSTVTSNEISQVLKSENDTTSGLQMEKSIYNNNEKTQVLKSENETTSGLQMTKTIYNNCVFNVVKN